MEASLSRPERDFLTEVRRRRADLFDSMHALERALAAPDPLRMLALLHDARPTLLNLGDHGRLDITARAGRVQLIDATCDRAGSCRHPSESETHPLPRPRRA